MKLKITYRIIRTRRTNMFVSCVIKSKEHMWNYLNKITSTLLSEGKELINVETI
jgi:hypothetical protein